MYEDRRALAAGGSWRGAHRSSDRPRVNELPPKLKDFLALRRSGCRRGASLTLGRVGRRMSDSVAEILVTLGDQPLAWFARFYGSHGALGHYGKTPDTYGRLHDLQIAGKTLKLLPLVHPRQAGRLGSHSTGWSKLHAHWAAHAAPSLLAST